MQVEQAGGLLVAPSGPGLAGDLIDSPNYRKALNGSGSSFWQIVVFSACGQNILANH